jgi:hypothetical protein
MWRRPARPAPEADLDSFESALSSLSLDALRRFTRDHLRGLDLEARRAFAETLIGFAARHGGWRPARAADALLLEDIRSFVRLAARGIEVSPDAIDVLFDRANKVFFAGEMELARDAYEALLRPLADAEIYLGQHEMYSEVLRNDLGDVVARYRVAVWTSAPPEQRAEALWNAVFWTHDLESWGTPLEQLERAAIGPLSGWEEFLPTWDAWVEAHWNTTPAHHRVNLDALRKEAALRARGADGLQQIAERSESPALWSEWIRALLRDGRLREALSACDTALARCAPTDYRRRTLARMAARVALALADTTALERTLHREWTLDRDLASLLDWAARDRQSAEVLSTRLDAEAVWIAKDARLQGITHLLCGRYQDAMRALDRSEAEELAPAMAWILLRGATSPSLGAIGASIGLSSTSGTQDHAIARGSLPEDALPSYPAVALAELLPGLVAWRPPSEADLREMQSTLERLAGTYLDEATSAKRRSAYARSAHFAVVCAEARAQGGAPAGARELLARIAHERRRWPAFRDELEKAVGASPSVRSALPSRQR